MKTQAANEGGDALQGRRPSGLFLLAAAVALLLLGVLGLDRARAAHTQALRAMPGASAELQETRGRQQLAQRNRALLEVSASVQQHAQRSFILPSYWSERQINMRQQSLTREQFNSVLLSTARSSNQLLKLEEFDVAVTHPDEGLFDLVGGARLPVLVSLRGSLKFRIADRPL